MKKTGKLITLILVVAMTLSLMSVAALADSSETYKDVVAGKWYVQYVDYVVENGLMSGMSEDTFAPNTAVNRAMFIQTLYALAEKPEVDVTDPFNDLAEGAYYENAANWAKEKGVASGMGDNTFAPNKEITRQEAATFFQAYAEKVAGADVSDASGMNKYPDADKVAKWAKNAMGWAVKNNIVSGSKDNGTIVLAPERGLTRAELAAMLKAFNKYLEGLKPVVVPDEIGYGTVVVTVKASDKAVNNLEVKLTGKDNDNNNIELTATTKNGVATFKNVPASDKAGYTAAVTNADVRYTQTPATGVSVEPEKTTEATIELNEKKAPVTVEVKLSDEAADAKGYVDGLTVNIVGKTEDNQYVTYSAKTKNGVATFENIPSSKEGMVYAISPIVEAKESKVVKSNDGSVRYKLPTEDLRTNGLSFVAKGEALALTLVLDVPGKTVNAEVKADGYINLKKNQFQFRVAGAAKNGSAIDYASEFTNEKGEATIYNVPVAKTKYDVELLNAPAWADVKYTTVPATGITAAADGQKVTATLSIKKSSVEVWLYKDGKLFDKEGVKVHLEGTTAGGVKYKSDAVTTKENGIATFKNVPYSDKNGYTVVVDDPADYAVLKQQPIVVDSEVEPLQKINLTEDWGNVQVTLNLVTKTKDDKGKEVETALNADGYVFKLVGLNDEGTYLSTETKSGVATFTKVPHGKYTVEPAFDYDFVGDIDISINKNRVNYTEGTVTNGLVIDSKNDHKSAIDPIEVDFNAVVKTTDVKVYFKYTREGNEKFLKGVKASIAGVPAYMQASKTNKNTNVVYEATSAAYKDGTYALYKDVPYGKYQLTIKDIPSDEIEMESNMLPYDESQDTYVVVNDDNNSATVVVISDPNNAAEVKNP